MNLRRTILAALACLGLALEAGATVKPDFVVAADGSGDFRTVQEAINACPDYSHEVITHIFIKPGIYHERVIIPHNKFRLHIYGQDAASTVITYGLAATDTWPGTENKVGTSGSATMYIHSSYVTLEDLTIANSAGSGKIVGQAVALFTDSDFLFVHRCRLLGFQDTLYTYGRYGKDGGVKRNYYLDCYIEGETDFIFGPSVCLFENCTIHSKYNSYITAASTFEGQKYGYVFLHCTLTADPGVDRVYLGRPWRPFAKTVWIECEMGAHIRPEGWHNWKKPDAERTSFYAEYGCTGPGSDTSARVSWCHLLSAEQAAEYTFEKIMFQHQDGIVWNPFDNK